METTVTEVTGPARLSYDDLGTGEPALVAIPGWCGDRTVFDDLLPLLAKHRRVLSVDLPGHGGSGRPAGDFGYAEVVDSVLGTMAAAGVERFVPVALSHAGWTALGLRRRLGSARVPGVVLLDWMVLGTPPGFVDALAGLQEEQAWEQVRAGLFAMWTTGIDDPSLHAYVASMGRYGFADWSRAGREIAGAFATQGSPLAALEQMATQGEACPTLHLYALPADDGVLAAQQAYAAEHPWFQVHRLAARSHFPMFEVPDELAAAVEGFAGALG
jgi:pimeloyl-ACP methyl ester carboxylesterase